MIILTSLCREIYFLLVTHSYYSVEIPSKDFYLKRSLLSDVLAQIHVMYKKYNNRKYVSKHQILNRGEIINIYTYL